MGKIQKIREQKKIAEAMETAEKSRRNKKIAVVIFSSVAGAAIVIYGVVAFLNWKIISNDDASSLSAPTASPSNNANTAATSSNSTANNTMTKTSQYATIKTDKGDIKLELYPDAAPKTVANFTDLIGKGFYNGLTFHRVVPGFVIQGGDPKGDGTGGPGYSFADEINPQRLGLTADTIKTYEAQGYKYDYSLPSRKMMADVLAMANSGPNTNGSQFFIVTDTDQPHLDGKHTVFGRVIEGMEIVKKIQQGDIMKEIKIID